jgi:ABC-type multidrug transport system fused ATPase/permease subunit
VRDNIKFGRVDASDSDMIAAAKLANAHDFISELPQVALCVVAVRV